MTGNAHVETHGITVGSFPAGLPAPDFFSRIPRLVEDLGFDAIASGDHIFHHAPMMECFTFLAHCAALTQRIKIRSSIALLPLRDPGIVAKEAATIDFLSGGRFILGAGVGGEVEREWLALGVDRKTRGRRMDEYLEILKTLWTGDTVDFEGQFRQMRDVTLAPMLRKGGPPIWIGGRSDAALKRAVRFDGWLGNFSSPRRARESIQKLKDFAGGELPPGFHVGLGFFCLIADTKEEAIRRAAERLEGGYRQDFTQIVDSLGMVGTADDVREKLQRYREAGVTDFGWVPAVPADEFPDQIARIADIAGVTPAKVS